MDAELVICFFSIFVKGVRTIKKIYIFLLYVAATSCIEITAKSKLIAAQMWSFAAVFGMASSFLIDARQDRYGSYSIPWLMCEACIIAYQITMYAVTYMDTSEVPLVVQKGIGGALGIISILQQLWSRRQPIEVCEWCSALQKKKVSCEWKAWMDEEEYERFPFPPCKWLFEDRDYLTEVTSIFQDDRMPPRSWMHSDSRAVQREMTDPDALYQELDLGHREEEIDSDTESTSGPQESTSVITTHAEIHAVERVDVGGEISRADGE